MLGAGACGCGPSLPDKISVLRVRALIFMHAKYIVGRSRNRFHFVAGASTPSACVCTSFRTQVLCIRLCRRQLTWTHGQQGMVWTVFIVALSAEYLQKAWE